MTLGTILWSIGIGAVVVALGATAYGVSPWRLFGLASLPGIVTVFAAVSEADSTCGIQATSSIGDWVLQMVVVLGLTLYGAAALGGMIDGVRSGMAGDYGPALSRALACPLASAVSLFVVVYAFLLAALHCYD